MKPRRARQLSLLLAAAFLLLGAAVLAGWTQALDEWLSTRLQAGGTPWEALHRAVSWPLDTWRGFLSAALLLGLVAWRAGGRGLGFVLGAGVGAVLLAHLAKLAYARPRPASPIEVLVPHPVTSSFPSGHVAWVAGFGGACVWLLVRGRGVRIHWIGTAGLLLAIGLMGLSRIYLGQHFLSDVLAGSLLGLGCVTAALALGGTDSGQA